VATEVPLPPCTANLDVPHTRHILGILGVLLGVPSMPSMCRVCSWTVKFTGAVCARRSTLSLSIAHAPAGDTNPKRKRGRRTIASLTLGQRCVAIEESDRSARRDAGGHIGDKRLPDTHRLGLPDTHRLGLPDTHRLSRGILTGANHSEVWWSVGVSCMCLVFVRSDASPVGAVVAMIRKTSLNDRVFGGSFQ
jgi:hypothetical protein